METDYLNMRDEQQRYPSLSIMEQFELFLQNDYVMPNPLPTPLCEEGSLLKVVESDFDYMENQLDTSGLSWGSEQELNGDMAVLPVSGVASVYPKMESLSEDFAKVLNDWQEHLGFLETCEFEERMNSLDIDRPTSRYPVLPENIFDDDFHPPSKSEKKILDDKSLKTSLNLVNDLEASSSSSAFDCPIEEINEETNKSKRTRKNLGKQKIKTEVKKEINYAEDLGDDNWFLDDIDLIETSSVLEAGDVTDLLEQFEASEIVPESSLLMKNDTKELCQEEMKKKKKREILNIKEDTIELPPTKKRKSEKKTTIKVNETVPKKSAKIQENVQRDVKKTLPKEVIDRIQASNRKKPISVIPALPEKKPGVRCKGTKMQNSDATNSRNKQLKIVSNKDNTLEGSVQLDHDYCSNGNTINSKSKTSSKPKVKKITKKIAKIESTRQIINDKLNSVLSIDNNELKKNNILESPRQNNNTREEKIDSKELSTEKVKKKQFSLKKVEITQIVDNKVSPIKENKTTSTITTTVKKQFTEMKVRPAVTTSILQTRKGGVITKTKSIEGPQKMISVLKKPPPPSLSSSSSSSSQTVQTLVCNKSNESIVTTTNSLNNEVQNIIVQTQSIDSLQENEKKPLLPQRKKLNLAEYRSRREQNRSDNSRTNSPIQPMTLVYIYHASTTTDPIQTDHDNVIWSEREIVSILKPKSEVKEIKVDTKPDVRDASVQTNETVFNQIPRSNFDSAPVISKKIERSTDGKRLIDKRLMTNSSSSSSTNSSVSIRGIDNKRSFDKQIESKSNDNRRQIEGKTLIENKRKIENKPIDKRDNTLIENKERIESKSTIENKRKIDNKLLIENKGIENKLENKSPIENKRIVEQNSTKSPENLLIKGKSDEPSKSIEKTNKKISSSNCSNNESTVTNNSAKDIDERIRTSKKVRNYRRRGSSESSRSLSRSRSRSRSRIRSRNRNRNRSRSKSRSCRRTPERRRRISHRRSSVSSSSSWSSRSYTKSSSSFRTRSSRSRSRSPRFSRSRSISRSRSRSKSRLRSRSRSRSSSRFSSCSRSTSRSYRRPYDGWYDREKQRQVEERRVIYVGRLEEGITKADLRRRFETFGPVVDISVHFREHGDNYGFVTFAYKSDAYKAVERGNENPSLPRYDLCFGGRRAFCKVKYADLDGAPGNSYGGRNMLKGGGGGGGDDHTFDLLLKEAQAKLRKRKV